MIKTFKVELAPNNKQRSLLNQAAGQHDGLITGHWGKKSGNGFYPLALRMNLKSAPIGIDLGVKDLAIVLDGRKYKNINQSKRVMPLEKRKKRFQRGASRHYERRVKDRCKKSRGLQNLEQEIRSVNKKIRDQHTLHTHQRIVFIHPQNSFPIVGTRK